MKALLFDVYRTLLDFTPPPADAGARWERLCAGHGIAPCTLAAFWERCEAAVAAMHAAAPRIHRAEVDWRAVVRSAEPALATCEPERLDGFIAAKVALLRGTRLMAGAAEVLRFATDRGLALGIVSNAQAYTEPEFDRALASAGLDAAMFHPDLVFWSYREGYAKPDPYVFRRMRFRCAVLGLEPSDVLMIGDRLDNDVEPSRAEGFRAAHLAAPGAWETVWSVLGQHPSPAPCGSA